VRPEKVVLTPSEPSGDSDSGTAGQTSVDNSLGPAQVIDVSFVGVSTQYILRSAWGQELMAFEQNTGARPLLRRGAHVDVQFAGPHAFLLDHDQDARAGVDEGLAP